MTYKEALALIRSRYDQDSQTPLDILCALYDCQHQVERKAYSTIFDNAMGYNRDDAPVLTPLARKVCRGVMLTKSEMFEIQARCRKYVPQYANYLSAELYPGY